MAAASTSTTASSAAPTFRVLTVTIAALTTTFTPPPTCTEHYLTQRASSGAQLWINDPQPVSGSLAGDCYPSQFMKGYTTIPESSSSIAPMLSPLVCPSGWHTAGNFDNGYIACCASGFSLALPSSTVDASRPAYGGSCYSNFEAGQTVNVTAYGTTGVTTTTEWVATSSADAAFGHIIDGYAAVEAAATTTNAPENTYANTIYYVPQDTSAAATTSASSGTGSVTLTGGIIAGIVVGVLGGLVLVCIALFLLYRRHRRKRAAELKAMQDARRSREKGKHISNSTGTGARSNETLSPILASPSRTYDRGAYERGTYDRNLMVPSALSNRVASPNPFGDEQTFNRAAAASPFSDEKIVNRGLTASPFSDEKIVIFEKQLPPTPFNMIMNARDRLRTSKSRPKSSRTSRARSLFGGTGTPRLNSSGPYELDGFVPPELDGR